MIEIVHYLIGKSDEFLGKWRIFFPDEVFPSKVYLCYIVKKHSYFFSVYQPLSFQSYIENNSWTSWKSLQFTSKHSSGVSPALFRIRISAPSTNKALMISTSSCYNKIQIRLIILNPETFLFMLILMRWDYLNRMM